MGVFVAAAARPSASRNAGIHPTDALGARRYEEWEMAAMRCCGGRAALFVAAAARPLASRNAGIHPTDALGARRYEEWEMAAMRCCGGMAASS